MLQLIEKAHLFMVVQYICCGVALDWINGLANINDFVDKPESF